MKILTSSRLWLCLALALAVPTLPAFADESAGDEKAMDHAAMAGEMKAGEMTAGHDHGGMDPAMMEAWTKAATPGEPHAAFAESVGTWDAHITTWMEPGAEPTTSAGTFERRMILGGRVLAEDFTGDFMGQPFHGHSLTGYDNVTGRYWSLWSDDMSTGPMISWGDWDDEVGGVVYVGEMSDPMTGVRTKSKSIWKQLEDGSEVFEMYEMRDGGEAKTMEIRSVKR